MSMLYPPIEPYSTGFLSVAAPHELYWEQSGNPDGVPVVVLHGGPGGGSTPFYRQYFDPDYYRIIQFDQRGSGKSTPHCCLEGNDPASLVADIEKLRQHLGIDQWHVFGGSWGATLALLYASAHPNPILSMVLRGIFLNEQEGIDWLFYQAGHIFPAAYNKFKNFIPEDEQHDLVGAYYKRFIGDDKKIRLEAAQYWAQYEHACAYFTPKDDFVIQGQDENDFAVAIATIEAHYFLHHVIAEKDSLLHKVDIFRHIPTIIIHGQYDMVCPIKYAYDLHQKWPEAKFITVADGGHSSSDPAVGQQLLQAVKDMKEITK